MKPILIETNEEAHMSKIAADIRSRAEARTLDYLTCFGERALHLPGAAVEYIVFGEDALSLLEAMTEEALILQAWRVVEYTSELAPDDLADLVLEVPRGTSPSYAADLMSRPLGWLLILGLLASLTLLTFQALTGSI